MQVVVLQVEVLLERRVSPSTLPSLGLLAFPLQPPLTAGCPRYAELDQSPRAATSRGPVGGVCQGSAGPREPASLLRPLAEMQESSP